MKTRTLALALFTLISAAAVNVAAQDGEGSVIIPSQMELSEEQSKDLQTLLDKELTKVVSTCVGTFPRPEFFSTLAVQFELRKSGQLRGGIVPAGVVDSNLYVASDEEKAKLEEDGSLARLVVRNDRDLERCLEKGTREFETKLSRYSATVTASYAIAWKGKTAALTSTGFEITKK